jgi:hypothetical protein
MGLLDKIKKELKKLDPTNENNDFRKGLDRLDFDLIPDDAEAALENIAFPLAQQWKNDHPNAQSGSDADFDDCVVVVAAGIAAAGAALGASAAGVGAVLGAAIGAGTGVPAARIVCRRVID